MAAHDDLEGWCELHLGSRPPRELFRDGYLSTVVGLELEDARQVVVKIRPPAPRLEGCFEVQRALHRKGYPCPEPLVGPAPFGAACATAECFVGGGASPPLRGRDPAPFAAWLATLVALAPPVDEVGSLLPSPPWTRWRHDEGAIWPMPDDIQADLNTIAGPAWLDTVGRTARTRLAAGVGAPEVVGHGDWYTGNLRWADDELHVAHDWDSVLVDREAAIVGFAGAVYPAVRAGSEATVEESQAFLAAYELARGREFSADERAVSWAAGLWLRAFDAKKQLARDGVPKSLNADEAKHRLRLCG